MSGAREAARALLRAAESLVVLTGAGISAESGVPTFRGSGGLWGRYHAEDLATPEAFRRDPRLVWAWYAWRREVVSACLPNAAHRALARLALALPGRFTLITQNVDALHEEAAREVAGGADPSPSLPLHLHGALFGDRCSGCGRRTPAGPVDTDSEETLPRCTRCSCLLRPDVVWFGEPLDPAVLDRAFEAATSAAVCLVVGTSGLVHPAASIPLATVRSGGALVEVNPEESALTPWATVHLAGSAATVLPPLLDEVARPGPAAPCETP